MKKGALDGLKVVEIGSMIAGPLCAQILGDHGAEVLKVESPLGDPSRVHGPWVAGEGAYYSALNRNKSVIALDLTRSSAREVLLTLLETADVLVENLLPDAMARWSLDYATVLAPRFPRLIYCGISGFGKDGPLGGRPGYDAVVQGYCGLMSINGTPESGPVRLGIAAVDIATGMNAATGVLLALVERALSGLGQAVDITLFDTALALQVPFASRYLGSGVTETATGNSHPTLVPYDKFETRNGELFVGVATAAQFRRLVACLGRPELADDPRFATDSQRVAHRKALDAELKPLFAQHDASELSEQLMRTGVPAAPVHTVPQAMESAHTAHRAMRVRRDDGYEGLGIPVKLGRTPGTVRLSPRPYGSDADQVLAAHGFSPEQVAALEAEGALLRQRSRR